MPNTIKLGMNDPCPCTSGKKYKKCCRPYHAGSPVPDVLSLVRARFCAYAIRDFDFIMATTHPEGTSYMADEKRWRARLDAFTLTNSFDNLTIIDSGEDWVHFTTLMRSVIQQEYISTEEHSTFKQVDGRWLYYDSLDIPDEKSVLSASKE